MSTMKNFGTVTICTQAYNTKKYIEQCVRSVLNQTYTDFEYFLIDNGCTDGSGKLMDRLAQEDSRIHLIRYEENQRGFLSHAIVRERAAGGYLAFLDSDDWWEPDYLERLLTFLDENDLDYAMTGTRTHMEATHADRVLRQVGEPVFFTAAQFAQLYPQYWAFSSTYWGSVLKTPLFLKADIPSILQARYGYGADTMIMLQYIKECARVGIDSSALYHYRIHTKSVSYKYGPRRFDSNVAYYEQTRELFDRYRVFDPVKQMWLDRMHLKAMEETLKTLKSSSLSADEKISECARIAGHPLTGEILTKGCPEQEQWLAVIWEILFSALPGAAPSGQEALDTALRTLAPNCRGAVRPPNLGLFARDASMREALRKDDKEKLTALLLEGIAQKRHAKQYDLGLALHGLIPEGTPLYPIRDTRFFQKYAEICRLILGEDRLTALDQMTALLLDGEELYAPELFLDLYLSLAALEEQVPAFIYGKLRLAGAYLELGRRDRCRDIVEELTGMGLESEELDALRDGLEAAR